MRRSTWGTGLFLVLALTTVPAAAQMHGGAQGHGQHQAGMQGNMQGMTGADRMMQNVDKMMTNVSTMMQDLSTMHAGMSGGGHDQVMTSMQGAFDQMRQLRGSLGEMMKDPTLMHNQNAMKSFEQACKNLEQMTTSFQSMAKNMTQAMKGMGSGKK
jgi:hypothetical protein